MHLYCSHYYYYYYFFTLQDGSWAIDEEEDEELRQAYPYASGHLYQVTLNKGQGGLGECVVMVTVTPTHQIKHTERNVVCGLLRTYCLYNEECGLDEQLSIISW